MSIVGAFPMLSDLRRRPVKAPANPLDKSTVVSIYPRDIDEIKPTIEPGRFRIPAGSYEKPSLLVVGPSSWWKEFDENQPLVEIPQHSVQIAESIVNDYCRGILGCDMGELMPGLFWVPGEVDAVSLVVKHKDLLDNAYRKQRNWYTFLVKMADSLWARTNGNPLTIGDDMRMAAQALNLVNKEWLKDQQVSELVRCIACGHLKNPAYPICSNCKAISDPEKAKALGLVFAQ